MKKPVRPKRPRNPAARALRSPLFKPKVVRNPKAYDRRRLRHIPPADDEEPK